MPLQASSAAPFHRSLTDTFQVLFQCFLSWKDTPPENVSALPIVLTAPLYCFQVCSHGQPFVHSYCEVVSTRPLIFSNPHKSPQTEQSNPRTPHIDEDPLHTLNSYAFFVNFKFFFCNFFQILYKIDFF